MEEDELHEQLESDEVEEQEDSPTGIKPPEESYIAELFGDLLEYHAPRNKWILEMRAHAAAEHELEMPETQHIQVHKLNLWSVRTYLNERLARFLPVPRVRILPFGPGDPAMKRASQQEKAINSAYYWMRRKGDDWGKVVSDVLLCEGGVELFEANTAAAWPMLIQDPTDQEDGITRGMPTGTENLTGFETEEEVIKRMADALKARLKARDDYKRSQPFPITNAYVPLESYFPSPDSDETEECIHIEFKSARKVMANKMFSEEGRNRLKTQLKDKKTFKTFIPILRYNNKEVYAYYALPDTLETDGADESFLKKYLGDDVSEKKVVDPILLYYYEPGVGRIIYNEIGGMHGGWTPGDHSLVIGRIKALAALDTKIDELASQGWTSLREEMWPTWKVTISKQRPASAVDAQKQLNEIHPQTAKDVVLFDDEDIQPMLPPREHPLYQPMMETLREAMAKIGGAPGLSGIHQPGVEGGFQENTLLQQADSQFARIENNIVTGAQNGALLFIDQCRAMGEDIFIRARVKDKQAGTMYFEELVLSPDDLTPRPEVDAVVKAKAVGNDSLALRTYASAITDINGQPGSAAMTRNKAREEFLDMEYPDEEGMGVVLERVMDAVKYPVIQKEIEKAFNLSVVEEAMTGVKKFNPEGVLQADPEIAAQTAAFASGQPPMQTPTAGGMPPGMTEGDPQPGQAAGRQEQIMADDVGVV